MMFLKTLVAMASLILSHQILAEAISCQSSFYKDKKCMEVRNNYVSDVCVRTLVHHRYQGSQWSTSSNSREDCISANESKSYVIQWQQISNVTDLPISEDTYFYFYTRDGRLAWLNLPGERKITCLSSTGFNSSVEPDAAYCRDRGGVAYAFRNSSLTLDPENAFKLDRPSPGAGSSSGKVKTDEEKEKEARRAEEKFNEALAKEGALQAKVDNCKFDELEQLAKADPSTIDLADFKERLLSCDPSFAEEIDKLKETVEALDLFVTEIKKSLDDNINPVTEAELIGVSRQAPYEDDISEFSLSQLFKIPDIISRGVTAFFDNAGELISRIDDYYVREVKDGFLVSKLVWGLSYAHYPDTFSEDLSTDVKIDYIRSVKEVADYLSGINDSDPFSVNEYGFDKESPVPLETQAAVVEHIEPKFPDEGAGLKAALMAMKGTLTPEQEKAILIIDSLAYAITSLGADIEEIFSGLKSLLQQITTSLTENLSCAAKVIAAGDYADYTEIITGVDFCTEEPISLTGRGITSLGMVIGSGKFWRTLADWGGIAVSKGRKVIPSIVEDSKFFGKARDAGQETIDLIGHAKFKEILNIPKGSRPEPDSYLPASYIEKHLGEFKTNTGASYLAPKRALDTFGRDLIGHPDGQFIMTKVEMDSLLSTTGGDVAKIENALGIEPGDWQGLDLVRIDIPEPDKFQLRMPTGNEPQANKLWLPGGKTPKNYREAVINQIPRGQYSEKDLF